MRIGRDGAKRADGKRKRRKSTDGPQCPYCEPHINAVFAKRQATDKHHIEEIADATRDRCSACGRFLSKGSLYTNRCSDCWGPEDEFLY